MKEQMKTKLTTSSNEISNRPHELQIVYSVGNIHMEVEYMQLLNYKATYF